MGKDSSTLILLFLDLSAFPKYVVLRSEFLLNLVVFNISDFISLYMSKYSFFNISGVRPKSNSYISFLFLPRFFPHLFTVLMPTL